MDEQKLTHFKRVLMVEKERILTNTRNTLANEDLNISPDDLPDEADLASTEINQSLVFKLRDRERRLLTKIDQALSRMENGDFGTCQICEEPIEPRRLEVRPVSTHCLACKEKQEHRDKIYA